jgi:hypothetical protein
MKYMHQNKQLPSFGCERGRESEPEVVWTSGHVEMQLHQVVTLTTLFLLCMHDRSIPDI